jgi:hypothetical protein
MRRAPFLVFIAATVAACGSDSPTGPSPRSLAVHFDSLWQGAVASNDTLRQIAMQYIAIPLAFGVPPQRVSITTDGSTAKYSAIAYEFVTINNNGTPYDSVYHFAAWSDSDANRVVITERAPAGNRFAAAYLDGGTEELGIGGTITDSIVSAAGTCSALDLASVYYEASYTTCSRSTEQASFDIQLTSYETRGSGGPSATEIKLSSTQLSAVRLLQHF